MTQTIANGATLKGVVNWRAVYDANGDKVEDDPGSIQFFVDGKEVLSPRSTRRSATPTASGPRHRSSDGSHTFEVRAVNGAGTVIAKNTVTATVANTTPPPPSSTGSVTQTIANGATLKGVVNWRAVYDANGDKVEDDPGSVQFLVDGKQVLSEINPPFGDTDGFWSSTSVKDGSHTFEVRAVNGAGTVIAKNTVTATVANTTPPPPSSTGAVTQTIANGATLKGVVNWRAVYDANGDKVEDDPGSIQFLVDGNEVCRRSTRRSAIPTASGRRRRSRTGRTRSRCVPSTTAAP